MGQLNLLHLMSIQRRRREAQAPSSNGMGASRTKRKRSPCQQDGDSRADEKKMCLSPSLPEDIWHHILSLMPMQDAARAASVSRGFLNSWRCHPNLTFTNDSLGVNKDVYRYESASVFIFYSRVSHILAMHSGIGLKTLQIHAPYYSRKDSCFLNSWLQTALAPGIEELTFCLYPYPLNADYNFPYSFLSNGSGESIRYIHLACCSFHPSALLGSLRSLTRLHLCHVRITGEEVERLLCNSPALERLEVRSCHEIVCLKVPSVLQQLSYLEVLEGDMLEAIDNEAPNLSSFKFAGGNKVSLCSLSNGSGESIRYIQLARCSFHPSALLGSLRSLTRLHLCRVRITGEEVERLLCNSPALERLEVRSCHEIVCLKVPSVLQQLSYLEVLEGDMLEAIDNEAPNLSSFKFAGGNKISLCSLSNGSEESIRYIHLARCSFHPSATLGSLRSLTRLHLYHVRITGEEAEHLLCNSPALERLGVISCHEIVCLKVPSVLQRLRYLKVRAGDRLEAIENKAPNLSSFEINGGNKISLGGTMQTKRLTIKLFSSDVYPRTELPSMMPNLEALTIHSMMENLTPAMTRSKFLHLRHLSIALHGLSLCPTDEYLPLADFLDAAPCLETFHLDVLLQMRLKHVSIFDDPSDLRQMQVYQHHSLKKVTIKGFCCAKSLVELTVHVVESAPSLECLILEAAPRCMHRCPVKKFRKCSPTMQQGRGAVLAICRYIEPKVPYSVELRVLEPCSCIGVQL